MNYLLRVFIVIAGLLLLWEGIVYFYNIPPYLLPAPHQVFFTLYEQSASISTHAIPTIIETILGLLCGIFFGCIAAVILVYIRPLSFWFFPVLIMSQAIPTFAIAPLLVIWLGYGLASKIATTTLMIFFPITSAFYDGLRQTHPGWLDLAKTMNAKKWREFLHMRIPAALPQLASGIRIAVVIAPMGAIVGEWVGSSSGLGYLMLNANARLQIDMMFAALIVIIVLALILYFSIDKMLRVLIWWQS